MKQLRTLTSRLVAIPMENVDTDQIIPARFLKTTRRVGLGKNLFADWRYNPDGTLKPDFPLNRAEARGAQILLAGANFGCGSSREHAPWALTDFGLRAVISTSFADIFCNNALKSGLLPVTVDAETHRQLFSLLGEEPDAEITIDLESQTISLPDGRGVQFPIDAFSKICLLDGVDPLGYLLKHGTVITTYEQMHPSRVNTTIV